MIVGLVESLSPGIEEPSVNIGLMDGISDGTLEMAGSEGMTVVLSPVWGEQLVSFSPHGTGTHWLWSR